MLIYLVYLIYCKIGDRLNVYQEKHLASLTDLREHKQTGVWVTPQCVMFIYAQLTILSFWFEVALITVRKQS